MRSRVSTKGQVTIPAEVRERLGLVPGTVVRFEFVQRGALLRKGELGTHPVDRAFGTLRLPKPVDASLDELRGARRKRR